MSSGRDVMMERWAEEYKLQQERNKKQMSFEFDYDKIRERELNDYLDSTYGHKAHFDPEYFDEEAAERREANIAGFREWLDKRDECCD